MKISSLNSSHQEIYLTVTISYYVMSDISLIIYTLITKIIDEFLQLIKSELINLFYLFFIYFIS